MPITTLLRAIMVLILASLLACGGGGSRSADDDGGSGGGGGGGGGGGEPEPEAWGPGDYPPRPTAQTYLTLSGIDGQQGLSRQFKVHVPTGYQASVPAPVLFCFHGYLDNAVNFCVTTAGMPAKSDQAGFVLVMPNGYKNSWNGGTCCGDASQMKLDDVAFVRAIVNELDQHLNIDHRRIYATGMSNGGYLSYRLACEAADLVAAVAPASGALGTNADTPDVGAPRNSDFARCTPDAPVSLLELHGSDDPLNWYSVFVPPSLQRMAEVNGCDNATVPTSEPVSGGDTTCSSYQNCDGVTVTACVVSGGSHCWFGASGCDASSRGGSDTLVNTDAVWSFVSKYRR